MNVTQKNTLASLVRCLAHVIDISNESHKQTVADMQELFESAGEAMQPDSINESDISYLFAELIGDRFEL